MNDDNAAQSTLYQNPIRQALVNDSSSDEIVNLLKLSSFHDLPISTPNAAFVFPSTTSDTADILTFPISWNNASSSSYSFTTWINIPSVKKDSNVTLFKFSTSDFGMEVKLMNFQHQRATMVCRSKEGRDTGRRSSFFKSKPTWRSVSKVIEFKLNTWQSIVITHSSAFVLRRAKVTAFVNTFLQFQEELVFPSSNNSTGIASELVQVVIGGGNTRLMLAEVVLYADALSRDSIIKISNSGPQRTFPLVISNNVLASYSAVNTRIDKCIEWKGVFSISRDYNYVEISDPYVTEQCATLCGDVNIMSFLKDYCTVVGWNRAVGSGIEGVLYIMAKRSSIDIIVAGLERLATLLSKDRVGSYRESGSDLYLLCLLLEHEQEVVVVSAVFKLLLAVVDSETLCHGMLRQVIVPKLKSVYAYSRLLEFTNTFPDMIVKAIGIPVLVDLIIFDCDSEEKCGLLLGIIKSCVLLSSNDQENKDLSHLVRMLCTVPSRQVIRTVRDIHKCKDGTAVHNFFINCTDSILQVLIHLMKIPDLTTSALILFLELLQDKDQLLYELALRQLGNTNINNFYNEEDIISRLLQITSLDNVLPYLSKLIINEAVEETRIKLLMELSVLLKTDAKQLKNVVVCNTWVQTLFQILNSTSSSTTSNDLVVDCIVSCADGCMKEESGWRIWFEMLQNETPPLLKNIVTKVLLRLLKDRPILNRILAHNLEKCLTLVDESLDDNIVEEDDSCLLNCIVDITTSMLLPSTQKHYRTGLRPVLRILKKVLPVLNSYDVARRVTKTIEEIIEQEVQVGSVMHVYDNTRETILGVILSLKNACDETNLQCRNLYQDLILVLAADVCYSSLQTVEEVYSTLDIKEEEDDLQLVTFFPTPQAIRSGDYEAPSPPPSKTTSEQLKEAQKSLHGTVKGLLKSNKRREELRIVEENDVVTKARVGLDFIVDRIDSELEGFRKEGLVITRGQKFGIDNSKSTTSKLCAKVYNTKQKTKMTDKEEDTLLKLNVGREIAKQGISILNVTEESKIEEEKEEEEEEEEDGESIVLEKTSGSRCKQVYPTGIVLGTFYVSNSSISFVPDADQSSLLQEDAASSLPLITSTYKVSTILGVYLRRYRLQDIAIEIFTTSTTLFFVYDSEEERNELASSIMHLTRKESVKQWPRKSYSINSNLLTQWKERRISNYDYIMALNTLAGRSFNDLGQYPIFPWVLADYTSTEIDLKDPRVYRDLSKPMGALNPKRLSEFYDRYESLHDGVIPPFLYGSHYSTCAGVVLYYLLRLEPFTSLHIETQGGKIDVADRLFNSISETWEMCLTSMSEVKELTPEFYSFPEFLRNMNDVDLGVRQDGVTTVGDVILPPWAKDSPEIFIKVMREALESEFVTEHLHEWIDLIFGYKQRGEEALKSHNVFYYLTYYGLVDIRSIEEESVRMATELQIQHFGQCPAQLLKNSGHPPRGTCRIPPSLLTTASNNNNNNSTIVKALGGTPAIAALKVLSHSIVTINNLGVVEVFYWNFNTTSDKVKVEIKPDESSFNVVPCLPILGFNTERIFDNIVIVGNGSNNVIACHKGGRNENLLYCTSISSADSSLKTVAVGTYDRVTCVASGKTFEFENEEFVITASADGVLQLWKVSNVDRVFVNPRVSSTPLASFYGHLTSVTHVDINAKASLVVSCSSVILVHCMIRKTVVFSIHNNNDSAIVKSVCVTDDGNVVVLLQEDSDSSRILKVYSPTARLLSSIVVEEDYYHKISFVPSSSSVIIARSSKSVSVIEIPSLRLIQTFTTPSSLDSPITCVSVGPSFNSHLILVTGHLDGSMVGYVLPCVTLEIASNYASSAAFYSKSVQAMVQSSITTVKQAQSLATHTIDNAKAVTYTASAIAEDAIGEAKSLYKRFMS